MSEATLADLPAPSMTPGFVTPSLDHLLPPRRVVSESATPAPVKVERAVYNQHVDRIFRLALRMTGNTAMAEDLTQDVFLRVFERLHQFRGDSGLGTWVH